MRNTCEIIHLLTDSNPIQVIVDAIINRCGATRPPGRPCSLRLADPLSCNVFNGVVFGMCWSLMLSRTGVYTSQPACTVVRQAGTTSGALDTTYPRCEMTRRVV